MLCQYGLDRAFCLRFGQVPIFDTSLLQAIYKIKIHLKIATICSQSLPGHEAQRARQYHPQVLQNNPDTQYNSIRLRVMISNRKSSIHGQPFKAWTRKQMDFSDNFWFLYRPEGATDPQQHRQDAVDQEVVGAALLPLARNAVSSDISWLWAIGPTCSSKTKSSLSHKATPIYSSS